MPTIRVDETNIAFRLSGESHTTVVSTAGLGFVVFGIAVVRTVELPRLAGIGLAISIPLFAVIGFWFDNRLQAVGSALMTVCAVWIVVAFNRGPGDVLRSQRGLADARAR